jgi:hypothetical protein
MCNGKGSVVFSGCTGWTIMQSIMADLNNDQTYYVNVNSYKNLAFVTRSLTCKVLPSVKNLVLSSGQSFKILGLNRTAGFS